MAGQRLSGESTEQAQDTATVADDGVGGRPAQGRRKFSPASVGWRLEVGKVPRTGPLWVPFDRTAGVYGPQGSGKTLDLLTPALLEAPGAALVTLTKVEDLLLTVDRRASNGRPVAVLDPFGLAPGLPELVWDPVAGCVDSMVAERRAKAFTAGTVKGAVAGGAGDDAARFYAAEGAKVLHAYFHAVQRDVGSARPFLARRRRGAEGELHLDDLSAGEVTQFVLRECSWRTPGSGKCAVTRLRSLLRFLHVAGHAPDLVWAGPSGPRLVALERLPPRLVHH